MFHFLSPADLILSNKQVHLSSIYTELSDSGAATPTTRGPACSDLSGHLRF